MYCLFTNIQDEMLGFNKFLNGIHSLTKSDESKI